MFIKLTIQFKIYLQKNLKSKKKIFNILSGSKKVIKLHEFKASCLKYISIFVM